MAGKRDPYSIETQFLPAEDREGVDKKYEEIVAYCQRSKTTFRDDEFPYDDFPNNDFGRMGRIWRFFTRSQEKWVRTTEIRKVFILPMMPSLDDVLPLLSPEWTVVKEPTMIGLCQGFAGDCGLVAVMASLVKFPEVLSALFPRKHMSKYGVYEVRLCVFGVWKSILVDDYFITMNDAWLTAFSQLNQLWPTLIQKALAKVYGGYLKLRKTSPAGSFQALTGHPVTEYVLQEMTEDEIWEALISARSAGFPMVASTSQESYWQMKRLGINKMHCLSLIDVKLWRGCRLVRVRDNNANEDWVSEWSFEKDSGKVLNEKDEKDLNGKKGDIGGSCWLELKHFKHSCETVDVCRLRPSWTSKVVNTTVGGEIDEKNKAIQISVKKTTKVCFSSMLPDEYRYGAMRTLLCLRRLEETTGDVGDVIHCFFVHCSLSTEDISLEPGSYLLMATDPEWWRVERNIVIHSSKPVNARLDPLNPTVLTDSFQKFVHRFGVPMPLNEQDAHRKVVIKKCWISNRLFMMIANNYSEDEYLHVRVNLQKGPRKFYRQMNAPPAFENWQVDVVPPMSRQIVLAQYGFYNATPKDDSGILVEYELSSESMARMWMFMKTDHAPSIELPLYIFNTVAIE